MLAGGTAHVAANLLHSRFERLCPNADYAALVADARAQGESLRVSASRHARMHVRAVSPTNAVSFVPCRGGAAATSTQETPEVRARHSRSGLYHQTRRSTDTQVRPKGGPGTLKARMKGVLHMVAQMRTGPCCSQVRFALGGPKYI